MGQRLGSVYLSLFRRNWVRKLFFKPLKIPQPSHKIILRTEHVFWVSRPWGLTYTNGSPMLTISPQPPELAVFAR